MSSIQAAPLTFWFKPEFKLELGTHTLIKTGKVWEKYGKAQKKLLINEVTS